MADDVSVETPWPMEVGSLVLREALDPDVEALLTLRNSTSVNRFMLRTHVEPETFRREWRAVPRSTTDFSCVAESEGALVAMGFLDVKQGMGQPGAPDRTEARIGYMVDPAFARQGVATRLAHGLLVAAFDRLGLRRVTAGCFAANAASVRVLEKVGMRREQHGVEDSWHAELGWIDGYEYAILDREWRARAGGRASAARDATASSTPT